MLLPWREILIAHRRGVCLCIRSWRNPPVRRCRASRAAPSRSTELRERRAPGCAQDYHQPGRYLPHREQQEGRDRQRKVARRRDGAGPHRIIERGEQQADDGGVDAGERRLGLRLRPQHLPERQVW